MYMLATCALLLDFTPYLSCHGKAMILIQLFKIKIPKQIIRISFSIFKGSEAVAQRCSVKMVCLEISQNSQVFSCEFWEISKNTFFYRTPLVAASEGFDGLTSKDRFIFLEVLQSKFLLIHCYGSVKLISLSK